MSFEAADEAAQNRMSRGDDSGGPRPIRSTSSGQLHANMSTPISRTSSAVSRTLQRHQPLWMHPDPEALPEFVSGKTSMLLVSIVNEDGTKDASISTSRKALKINVWLETLMGLLQQGCDWEVYSYILVHLPSQLTNQALFRAAMPQITQP